jgi:putative flippase GtrA
MSNGNNRLLLRQIGKFGVVGIFGSALNYLVFYILLVLLDINYLIAGAIGFLTPVPIVFIVNRSWTFKSNLDFRKGLSTYTVTSIIALVANFLTQIFVREVLGVPDMFTQLFGIFVSSILNFILAKFLVFERY